MASGFDDETIRLPPGSPWGDGGGLPAGSAPFLQPPAERPVPHAYPLATRDASFGAALGLMGRTLPYAAVRFAVLFGASLLAVVWLVITLGGATWLGAHIAKAFGVAWLIAGIVVAGWVWGTLLRYALHLIECGHVAVITELVTTGRIGAGGEGMFAHGKRVVLARIRQETLLFGLNALVRGVVQSIHRTLDWIAELLPIPGLEGIARVIDIVLRGATRYLDKVVFSYNLARNDEDPWRSSRDGLIYYAQNAKPVLQTAIWSVLLDYVLTALLWLVLLIPAGLVTLALPAGVREWGAVATIVVALLLAGPLRAAFIRPVFLIMMIVRFHACVEGQKLDPGWDARLSAISGQFRELGAEAAGAMGRGWLGRRWGGAFS